MNNYARLMYSAKSARGDRTRADKKALAYARARATAKIRAATNLSRKPIHSGDSTHSQL